MYKWMGMRIRKYKFRKDNVIELRYGNESITRVEQQ